MVSACFVAVPTDAPATVAGFYTLAASSVLLSELPDSAARKLPRYPAVPVARLGRLAVDQRFTGLRLGSALIWDAGQKALASSVAAFALVVDAKDEAAAAFYRHHDFLVLGEGGLQLFRPLANFRR